MASADALITSGSGSASRVPAKTLSETEAEIPLGMSAALVSAAVLVRVSTCRVSYCRLPLDAPFIPWAALCAMPSQVANNCLKS
eukprot:5141523-Pyramimonas_sp.AAC.1